MKGSGGGWVEGLGASTPDPSSLAHRCLLQRGIVFPVTGTLVGKGVAVFDHAAVDALFSDKSTGEHAVIIVSHERCRLQCDDGSARTKSPEVDGGKLCQHLESARINVQDLALARRVLAVCFLGCIDPEQPHFFLLAQLNDQGVAVDDGDEPCFQGGVGVQVSAKIEIDPAHTGSLSVQQFALGALLGDEECAGTVFEKIGTGHGKRKSDVGGRKPE